MSTTVAAVVCWVDAVLAKLATFILVVAQGLVPHLSKLSNSNLLRSQREDETVHAAAQLPERWESIIDVIGSNTASPAAIRLATRLLFAALVMGPQLNGERQWADSRIQPLHVISAILRNTERKYINGLFVNFPEIEYDDEERTSLAMLVILFSTSHTAQNRDLTPMQAYQPLVRIQNLSRLLDVLQIAFYRDTTLSGHMTLPCVNLDTAQTVLIRWGNLFPWSWSTWSDQRLANVECITDLTITWLYHLNTPFCTGSSSECPAAFSFHFDSMISDKELYLGTIIVHLFNRIMLHAVQVAQRRVFHGVSSDLVVVLRKACSMTVRLLRYHAERRDATHERVVQSICRSLQVLFFWLDDKTEYLGIKDLILEILSLIRPDIMTLSFRTLCEDKHLQAGEKIDEDVVRSIEKIDLWDDSLSDVTATVTCLSIKHTVCFLTLIWNCDLDDYISISSSLSLISKGMDLLEEKDRSGRVFPILKTAILTFASVTSRFVTPSSMEEGLFWVLAIQSKYTDFSIASALAHRILMTGGQNIDSLGLAEAWDYLCNVLLVILGGPFAEDDGSLALLVCPGVCTALTKLFQTDSFPVDFVMSSPWTASLIAELDSLVSAECSSVEEYLRALQQQLRRVGKAFLNQLANRKSRLSEDADMVIHDVRWRLVYSYIPPNSHIVLASLE
ncbi:hypothetical protein H2248_000705 [Termitomyces sp. 'cryptogamus']|nr:hypothetical protein H2248_000705 [Termitomyces sp. 'cryptogamus']